MQMQLIRRRFPMLITIASLLCASLLTSVCGYFHIPASSSSMLFLLAVLFTAALTGSIRYAMLCAVGGALIFNCVFTKPYYTLRINDSSDLLLIVFLIVTASITGSLTVRLQHERDLAARSARSTNQLYQIVSGFLHVTGKREIVLRGIEYIDESLHFPAAVLLYGEDAPYVGQKPPTGACVEYDIPSSTRGNLGVLRVQAAPALLDGTEGILAKSVAAQIGNALERESIYDEREQIRVQMESEQLRASLLRAVAHDLRSPLTALRGTSALLSEQLDTLSDEDRRRMTANISEEIVWLSNLVENILNMTRFNEGHVQLNKSDEVVDDVAEQACTHMQRLLCGHKLTVTLPDEVMTVPMDGALIVQVLINLLDNAVRHTPPETAIRLSVAPGESNTMRFEVADTGTGIDPAIRDTLFERFVTMPNRDITDHKHGIGLGLSICRAIVLAHGGRIWAEQNKPCGARFIFELPRT